MVKSKAFKIVWDRQALEHFKDILTYLEKQSNQAPVILKSAVLSNLNLLKRNPFLFEVDKLKISPGKDFRAFIVYSYRVTYQIHRERMEIRVLRIRHTGQEPLGY